jgi:hypothetical protein
MKNLVVVFSLFIFLSSSCDKNDPDKEIPIWLKNSIENDEQAIKEYPQSWKNFGVWFRYSWNGEYHFEYVNPLSSSIVPPISQAQDTLNYLDPAISNKYQDEKCCQKLVWKGPKYDDLPH